MRALLGTKIHSRKPTNVTVGSCFRLNYTNRVLSQITKTSNEDSRVRHVVINNCR